MATQAERNAAIAAEAKRQRDLAAAQAKVSAAQARIPNAPTVDLIKKMAGASTKVSEIAGRAVTKATARPKVLSGSKTSLEDLQKTATKISESATSYGQKVADITQAEKDLVAAQAFAEQYGTPINIPVATTTNAGNSAYDLLFAQFSQYGLGALVEPLKNLITNDTSEGELTLLLRQTEPYKKRFAANATRINKGLRALSEAEYLSLEDGYQSIMRNYGLPASYYTKGDLGRQEGFEKFIAGDVSPAELEERIMTAQKRVLDAAPEITTALKQFYPDINNSDILSYTLDPERGLADIKKKITAAEIGGAALGARLATTVGRAEELARYGVTADTARAGFGAIGGGLERGRQLADIYQQPDYTQAVAEEEVFNLPGQAQAGQKRKKIIGMEKATFGGQTGITSGALSRDRAGSY